MHLVDSTGRGGAIVGLYALILRLEPLSDPRLSRVGLAWRTEVEKHILQVGRPHLAIARGANLRHTKPTRARRHARSLALTDALTQTRVYKTRTHARPYIRTQTFARTHMFARTRTPNNSKRFGRGADREAALVEIRHCPKMSTIKRMAGHSTGGVASLITPAVQQCDNLAI
eukprot:3088294-Pleurochrysis_carterae.AAC.1